VARSPVVLLLLASCGVREEGKSRDIRVGVRLYAHKQQAPSHPLLQEVRAMC